MNSINKIFKNITAILAITFILSACKKQLEIPPPIDQLSSANVYKTKAGIDAAVVGMYNAFASIVKASYYLQVIRMSDEGYYNVTQSGDAGELIAANITAANTQLPSLLSFYSGIYRANDIIENLQKLPAGIITDSLRNAYIAAAKYVRAAEHFSMVSTWGDVPLITATSVDENINKPRTPASEVYAAIIKDLQESADALPTTVITANSLYIHNKYQPLALLAKVYLYLGRWADAEAAATTVINSAKFELVVGVNNVFKRGSKEILMGHGSAVSVFDNRAFLSNLILPSSSTTAGNFPSLSPAMFASFETADQRKVSGNWIINQFTRNYCNKYLLTASATAPQDYIYQRLAEIYLIRAEAKTEQNNITGTNSAKSDVDAVRTRAGLSGTSATDKTTMMAAIEKERICELFYEGHRWYDLKRWGKLDAVLGTLSWKSANYKPYYNLWPIAQPDLDKSPSLTQNPGYQ